MKIIEKRPCDVVTGPAYGAPLPFQETAAAVERNLQHAEYSLRKGAGYALVTPEAKRRLTALADSIASLRGEIRFG